MMDEGLPDGPDLDEMLELIHEAFPDTMVDRETFARLVGSMVDPDYAAFDRYLPHPVYAKQRWISILNPSYETVRDTLMPLIAQGHDRLVSRWDRGSEG